MEVHIHMDGRDGHKYSYIKLKQIDELKELAYHPVAENRIDAFGYGLIRLLCFRLKCHENLMRVMEPLSSRMNSMGVL